MALCRRSIGPAPSRLRDVPTDRTRAKHAADRAGHPSLRVDFRPYSTHTEFTVRTESGVGGDRTRRAHGSGYLGVNRAALAGLSAHEAARLLLQSALDTSERGWPDEPGPGTGQRRSMVNVPLPGLGVSALLAGS